MNNKKSLFPQIIISAVILLLAGIIYKHFIFNSLPNVITWDVFGYYSWLIGFLGEGEFFQLEMIKQLHESYHVSGTDLYQVVPVDNGRYVPIYTFGLAIMFLPFYLMACLAAILVPSWTADGMSLPFQLSILTASLVYSTIGLVWLYKSLKEYYSDQICAITILVLVLGTNYFNYTALENGMPHTYLFTLYAGIIWFTIRWHRIPTYKNITVLGLLIALAALIRPTEIIALIIPGLYGIGSIDDVKSKWSLIIKCKSQVLFAAVLMLIAAGAQSLIWYVLTNQFWYNAYAVFGHKFDFLNPHLMDGLFSFRKGWLLYTPIMIFAFVGFLYLKSYAGKWIIPFTLYFIVNLYIVLSWHMWWYAGSFGMRALVQSYAVMSFPLAAFLQRHSNGRIRFLLIVAICLFTILNLFQNWQYVNKILPPDKINITYYKLIFGAIEYEPEYRKYLETNERLAKRDQYSRKLLIYEDFTAIDQYFPDSEDSTQIKNKQPLQITSDSEFGRAATIIIDTTNMSEFAGLWILVQSELKYIGELFNDYNGAKLVVSIERGEQNLKWTGVSFQKFTQEGAWSDVSYEIKIPESLKPGDQIKAYIWNPSPDTVFVRSIELFLLEESFK